MQADLSEYPSGMELDKMDILSIVQIIAGIGTFIASMISLFTLIEMRQQRRASMMPGLFIENRNMLYILRKDSCNNRDIRQLASIWSNKADISQDMPLSIIPHYGIKLFNAGIGTAVNIRYEWEFDVDAYLVILQKFNTSRNITLAYKDSNPEDNGYAFRFIGSVPFPSDVNSSTPKAILVQTNGLNSKTYKLAFLPSSQSMDISLPGEFTALFNLLAYSWLFFDTDSDRKFALDTLSAFNGQNILKLNIYYNDIGGKKYKKSYSLSILPGPITFKQSSFLIESSNI